MTEEKKTNPLIVAIVIILALFIVLETCSVLIGTIDTTDMPANVASIIEAFKFVFAAAPFAIALGFGRSIYGFTVNWLRANRKEEATTEYSLKWLSETVIKFEGWIVLVTPFVQTVILNLPDEKKAVAMAVTGSFFALVSIVFSEVKRIIKEVRANGEGG